MARHLRPTNPPLQTVPGSTVIDPADLNQASDPPRRLRPHEWQLDAPLALILREPIGSMPVLYGPAHEVWDWLHWIAVENQITRILFPSFVVAAEVAEAQIPGMEPKRLLVGLRQLFDHGLLDIEPEKGREA